MKSGIKIIVAGISIFILGGCASAPTTTGYLSDYDQLAKGRYLEKYRADTSRITKMKSPSILLGKISVDKVSDQRGITVEDCVSMLKADLKEGGLISDQNLTAPVRLDLAITELNPGSASGRIWAGELGVGHAHLQIEGKVVDVKTGQVLAAFAERHGSSGDIGVDDFSGDAGPKLIRKMIKLTSERVNKELALTFSLR